MAKKTDVPSGYSSTVRKVLLVDTESGEILGEATAQGDDTTYYYIDSRFFNYFTLQIEDTAGVAGTNTYTIEGSAQDDGTIPASCSYQDVTNTLFGVANVTGSNMLIFDSPMSFRYVRVKVVRSADGGNEDGAWKIYLRKMN